MRIAQLRQREDLDAVVIRTLAEGLTSLREESTSVTGVRGRGQEWFVQALLSAYFTRSPSPVVRRFLRDSFRFTPKWTRLPAQALLASLLSSPLGLRATSRHAFAISPPVEPRSHVLIVPGNQRVRLFDFSRGEVIVFLKAGFDPKSMERELEVRRKGRGGPFPPVLTTAHQPLYFSEPILDGFALPRCPPWLNRRAVTRLAVEMLGDWLEPSYEVVATRDYLAALTLRIEGHLAELQKKFTFPVAALRGWVRRLAEEASAFPEVPAAFTHGDFQAGNLFVARDARRVWLLDWEHAAQRFAWYDYLVFGLDSRATGGIGGRLADFLAGRRPVAGLPADQRAAEWRRMALALFLLEDLEWYLHESGLGPYSAPSRGLILYLQELERFGSRLAGLFGTG
jgi:hypothetical protein